jgi:MFS family permease
VTRQRTIVLFLIVFSSFLGGTVVLPTLPLYAQRHFNLSPDAITILLDSFFIAQFVASPWIGKLSDRYGRIPVLLISQFGTVISFVMLGAAATVPMLFAARILDGITGGNIIVAQAYIADISPREKRTQSLSIVWMAFGLSYILGPAVGSLVASIANEEATFLIGAGISLLSLLLTWLLLDESLTPEVRAARQTIQRASMRVADVFANAPLVLILTIAFGTQFGLSLMTSTLALFGEAVIFVNETPERVQLGVGALLVCVGVGQFFTQLFLIKPLVGRFGERRLVVFGTFCRGVSLLVMAVFLVPLAAGGALLAFAAASGLLMPSLQSLATTSVDREHNGVVLGYYQAAISLGIITGTWLGGAFFNIAPTIPYALGSVLMFCTVIPALLLMRRAQPVPVAA